MYGLKLNGMFLSRKRLSPGEINWVKREVFRTVSAESGLGEKNFLPA